MNCKKILVNVKGIDIELEQLPNGKFKKPDISKIFEGYKYGIAPLKAITEPLLVFRKTPKNGSVLEDLMNLHDSEISPAVLDIEGNRVGIDNSKETDRRLTENKNNVARGKHTNSTVKFPDGNENQMYNSQGRFPCTMFLNSEAAELLDSQLDVISFELNGKLYQEKRKEFEFMIWQHTQNGTLQGCKVLNVEREIQKSSESDYNFDKSFSAENARQVTKIKSGIHHGDSGYLSRVMHTCDFTQDDYDSYVNSLCAYTNELKDDRFYCPTVSPKERNAGCESLGKKELQIMGDFEDTDNHSPKKNITAFNGHPTLKPISLIKQMSQLFRQPKGLTQTVYVPFSGTGSEIIGLIQAGYNPNNIIGCEINPEYVEIAKARITYWSKVTPNITAMQATKEIPQTPQVKINSLF